MHGFAEITSRTVRKGTNLNHMKSLFVLVILAAVSAQAALAPTTVKPGSIAKAVKQGFLAGGEAGREFSLIDTQVKKTSDSESVALFYGDEKGQPLKGKPGFFQITLDRSGKRIVIDLAQMSRTAVDPDALRKKLKDSKFVASLDMTMDPVDFSTNITLNLKEPVELAVESSDGANPSRLALTLKSAPGAKK